MSHSQHNGTAMTISIRACGSAMFVLLALAPFVDTRAVAGSVLPIDWERDIAYMRQEMPKHHRNLFHNMTPGQFEQALLQVQQRLPELDDVHVAVEIMRIVALIRDAHSGVDSIPPSFTSRYAPLKFYAYTDGLAVQAAAPEHASLLGERLVAVDGIPIDKVMRRVAEVTDSSNAGTQNDFAPLRLSRPDLLAALGIVKDPERVAYTLEANGKTHVATIAALPRMPDGTVDKGGMWLYFGPAPGSNWLDAVADKNRPLWLSRQTDTYWFQLLPKSNALYVQCNFILNKEGGESFADFFARTIAIAEQHNVDRYVLDLRLNGGGDNSLLLPVVHRFIRSDRINRRGHFFVLMGRRTQSAAQNFVNQLELHTEVTFVGESTGESPNMYGDPEPITLPSSGIVIDLSTLWWQDMGPNDHRDATGPTIPALLSSDDYRLGRDPALKAALEVVATP